MRRAWKHVAERGDKTAFSVDEVGNALARALEVDSRDELHPSFLQDLLAVFRAREASLFRSDPEKDFEPLSSLAGHGIGQVILEFSIYLASNDENGAPAAEKAVVLGLLDRSARSVRQVEEHYLRKATQPRAMRVRAKLESAISFGRSQITRLARRLLKLETGAAPLLKKRGIDDGVSL